MSKKSKVSPKGVPVRSPSSTGGGTHHGHAGHYGYADHGDGAASAGDGDGDGDDDTIGDGSRTYAMMVRV